MHKNESIGGVEFKDVNSFQTQIIMGHNSEQEVIKLTSKKKFNRKFPGRKK